MNRTADSAWLRDRPRRWPKLPHVSGRMATAMVMAALVASAVRYLTGPERFPVETVRYQGQFEKVDARAFKTAVAPYTHGNFFMLNLNALRDHAQAVPWVDKVSVTRTWPPALIVHFTIQQPTAHWSRGGWINQQGQVVHLGGQHLPVGLPELTGPAGSEPQVFARLRALAPMLAPYGLSIQSLVLSARGGWRMVTTDGTTIVLGRAGVTPRLQRFLSLLAIARKDHDEPMRRVDLRYSNGFAVSWAASAQVAARSVR